MKDSTVLVYLIIVPFFAGMIGAYVFDIIDKLLLKRHGENMHVDAHFYMKKPEPPKEDKP